MHLYKILFIIAVGLICINARGTRRQKRVRYQTKTPPTPATSCGCPIPIIDTPCACKSILEPIYNGLGFSNSENILFDEVANYGCGCNYGILNSEVPNFGRVPALPKVIGNYDAAVPAVPMPAINLPSFVVDLPSCSGIPPYVTDLPYQSQASIPSYQFIEGPCSCRVQVPIVEYLSSVEAPSLIPKLPYTDPYYIQLPRCNCQPQVIDLPYCGCQLPKIDFACQNIITPCGFDNGIKVPYGMPFGYDNLINYGLQNVMQCGSPLPVMNAPFGCQICQLSPVELPVYDYGYQILPPPVIGCGEKYLRQITLPPPFL